MIGRLLVHFDPHCHRFCSHFRLLGLNMLLVYHRARLATMTIVGRPVTVTDQPPGESHPAPEAVEITTA